jgi:hypothetical protein
MKEVDDELDHWTGELTDPRRAELIEEEQWLATQLELIGDPPPPMVREETRYLAAHAQPPPVEELYGGVAAGRAPVGLQGQRAALTRAGLHPSHPTFGERDAGSVRVATSTRAAPQPSSVQPM